MISGYSQAGYYLMESLCQGTKPVGFEGGK